MSGGILQGRRALVTGGAGALGRVIVAAFADAGADVAVVDLDLAGAERVAAQARESGVRAVAVGVDLTDFDAVQSAIGGVIAEWGRSTSCSMALAGEP